jgi:hypothetical protein
MIHYRLQRQAEMIKTLDLRPSPRCCKWHTQNLLYSVSVNQYHSASFNSNNVYLTWFLHDEVAEIWFPNFTTSGKEPSFLQTDSESVIPACSTDDAMHLLLCSRRGLLWVMVEWKNAGIKIISHQQQSASWDTSRYIRGIASLLQTTDIYPRIHRWESVSRRVVGPRWYDDVAYTIV